MPKVTEAFVEARREEILNACERLYRTVDFKDITVKDIADMTSLSRASVYNYFQTKEEIFLGLLKREYDLWSASLFELRDEIEALSVGEFARMVGEGLAKRWQLLKIMSMNHYDMESNSRLEELTDFKASYGRSMDAMDACLTKFFPQMDGEDREDFIYGFFPFMFGIYPYTFVKEKQREAMEGAGVDYVFMSISELSSRFIRNLLAPFAV